MPSLLFKGCLLLQLHAWEVDADEHLHMGSPDLKPCGNGVLLWFQTESFDAAVARARELHAEILEEPHLNPNAPHREC